MKKVLILAITAIMSLGAKAQLISSNTAEYRMTPAVTQTPKNYKNYKRIGLSYNSINNGDVGQDALSGVSLDILKGISVSSKLPLYIETGIGITYGWWSKSVYDEKVSLSYLGLKVPINVTYRYEIANGFRVAPFLGIYFKGNILGSAKYENSYEEESANFYSKDDFGSWAATRFNAGIDFGVNIEWEKLYLGISYAKDFNKFFGYDDAGTMGIFAVTLGIVY